MAMYSIDDVRSPGVEPFPAELAKKLPLLCCKIGRVRVARAAGVNAATVGKAVNGIAVRASTIAALEKGIAALEGKGET